MHERLFVDWAAGKTPRLYTDEIRQPCSAANLAEVMVELLERNDVRGVFHWGGADALSRHELAVRVRERFKLSEAQAPLVAVSRADDPREAARRPENLALELKPLAGRLKTKVETYDEQLEQLVVPPPFRDWYLA